MTTQLIRVGLSVQQNFPICKSFPDKVYEVTYANMQDLSIVLKNRKYEDDEIYANILEKDIMAVLIRFDDEPKNLQEIDNPKCHLTLGQFKNCIIPVSSPIIPSLFISFILRNFYNTAFIKFSNELIFQDAVFDDTITNREKNYYTLLFFNLLS